MAKAVKDKIDPRQIGHLKKLVDLLPLLSALRDCGCARDAAGNRALHFDQYVTLVLLYLFNPLINSMRVLQEASAVEKVIDEQMDAVVARQMQAGGGGRAVLDFALDLIRKHTRL